LLLPCIIILFLHLLSTNHKYTPPCHFPLLLKPAAQKEKMDWYSLTRSYRLRVARLPFLWSYGVFHCSVSLRVIIVFRDITYVIIILHSWHLVICEHFWPYVWNNWSWVMHTMSTWFWYKNRVWHLCPVPTRSDFITFQRLENLHVAMPAKAQTQFLGCVVRRSQHTFTKVYSR
jgi:hypothetical protein